MTQRWMERRNNERKNKSGKYFCLKLQDTTYLNRGNSPRKVTTGNNTIWVTFLVPEFRSCFLEALFEQGTCVNNSHNTIFFAKKIHNLHVCLHFCMYILVCTCLYTYISMCGYLHMLVHVQLCAHTIARG